jgi:hypothetical protein
MAKHSTGVARPRMQSTIDRGVSANLSMVRYFGSSGCCINVVGCRKRMLSVIISRTRLGCPFDRCTYTLCAVVDAVDPFLFPIQNAPVSTCSPDSSTVCICSIPTIMCLSLAKMSSGAKLELRCVSMASTACGKRFSSRECASQIQNLDSCTGCVWSFTGLHRVQFGRKGVQLHYSEVAAWGCVS